MPARGRCLRVNPTKRQSQCPTLFAPGSTVPLGQSSGWGQGTFLLEHLGEDRVGTAAGQGLPQAKLPDPLAIRMV